MIALALLSGCGSTGALIADCSLLPKPMTTPIKPSKKDLQGMTERLGKKIENFNVAATTYCKKVG